VDGYRHRDEIDAVSIQAHIFGALYPILNASMGLSLVQLVRTSIRRYDMFEMLCQAQRCLSIACPAIPGELTAGGACSEVSIELPGVGRAVARILACLF
jgi:hypothetical protein